MKLSVQQIFEALPVITVIIQQGRQMPQKGAYRLARLHAKLLPEFQTIAVQRDGKIKAYDFPLMMPPKPSAQDPLGQGPMVPRGEYTVPPEKLEEFTAWWTDFGSETVEVDVQPIPLAQLDLGDSVAATVTAAELSILGDLVVE